MNIPIRIPELTKRYVMNYMYYSIENVKLDSPIDIIFDWLIFEVGKWNKHWSYHREGTYQHFFYFKNKEDKIKFILKWL